MIPKSFPIVWSLVIDASYRGLLSPTPIFHSSIASAGARRPTLPYQFALRWPYPLPHTMSSLGRLNSYRRMPASAIPGCGVPAHRDEAG